MMSYLTIRSRAGWRIVHSFASGRRATAMVAVVMSTLIGGVPDAKAQPDMSGMPETADAEALRWQPTFAVTTDSCYPSPAVNWTGITNHGMIPSGPQTGQCRDSKQLREANTYYRRASIVRNGSVYSVHMYALYFMKDQITPYLPLRIVDGFGHRHDWEFVLVWTKDGRMTHAGFSQHGNVVTFPASQLRFAADRPTSVLTMYFKDSVRGLGHVLTRAMRPVVSGETAPAPGWLRPKLWPVDPAWSQTPWVDALRGVLNRVDFGKAICPVKDGRFQLEISKNPPQGSGFPSAADWRLVQADSLLRNFAHEPPMDSRVVARWRVFRDRVGFRDNRSVNLRPGTSARVVVHLPSGVRDRFAFTLKHDKNNRRDQPRSPVISHGATVSGSSWDWISFGSRIYLGDRTLRGNADPWRFIDGDCFYVDLVRD